MVPNIAPHGGRVGIQEASQPAAPHNRREFSAEVRRVNELKAQVLVTDERMNVRRVGGEKHPAST